MLLQPADLSHFESNAKEQKVQTITFDSKYSANLGNSKEVQRKQNIVFRYNINKSLSEIYFSYYKICGLKADWLLLARMIYKMKIQERARHIDQREIATTENVSCIKENEGISTEQPAGNLEN